MTSKMFLVLLSVAVILLVCAPCLAQESAGRVTDVVNDGNIVTISYDLAGDHPMGYRVLLFLIDEQNPSFRMLLHEVKGDVGEGVLAGSRKRMQWDMKREGNSIAEGQSYRFVLEVTPLSAVTQAERGGGWPWYVYAGGAVVAGAAAVLLTGGAKEESAPSVQRGIPLPPAR